MISLKNIDYTTLDKLFDGYGFPYLLYFSIRKCNMKRLKKEFTNHFPILRRLCIMNCNIEMIENDSVSNLKQLDSFVLTRNPLDFIEKNTFSNLKNLREVNLSFNKLKNFDPEFIGLGNSVNIKC